MYGKQKTSSTECKNGKSLGWSKHSSCDKRSWFIYLRMHLVRPPVVNNLDIVFCMHSWHQPNTLYQLLLGWYTGAPYLIGKRAGACKVQRKKLKQCFFWSVSVNHKHPCFTSGSNKWKLHPGSIRVIGYEWGCPDRVWAQIGSVISSSQKLKLLSSASLRTESVQ